VWIASQLCDHLSISRGTWSSKPRVRTSEPLIRWPYSQPPWRISPCSPRGWTGTSGPGQGSRRCAVPSTPTPASPWTSRARWRRSCAMRVSTASPWAQLLRLRRHP
jgi:hypothetical protein